MCGKFDRGVFSDEVVIMNKHTKGPWTIGEGGAGCFYILSKAENGFGDNRLATADGELPNALANALLMAAAPEMLAALIGVFQKQAPNFNFDSSNCPEMQAVADAIKKAKGRS